MMPPSTSSAGQQGIRPRLALRGAAVSGLIGGIALFADLGFHAFGSLGRSYYVLATVMALALLGTPVAIWSSGALSGRSRRPLARAGTAIFLAGTATWVTAFLLLMGNPDEAFSQKLTPAGSLLLSLGMLLIGIDVLRARVLTGWRRFAPVAVGVYFPAQLVVQVAFFLNGHDADPGPQGLLLGSWGLLWALAAWSMVSLPQLPRRLHPSRPAESDAGDHRGAIGTDVHDLPGATRTGG